MGDKLRSSFEKLDAILGYRPTHVHMSMLETGFMDLQESQELFKDKVLTDEEKEGTEFRLAQY